MRSPAERDEQTLDIASAVFGSTVAWAAILVVAVAGSAFVAIDGSGIRVLLVIAVPAYVVSLFWRLAVLRRSTAARD